MESSQDLSASVSNLEFSVSGEVPVFLLHRNKQYGLKFPSYYFFFLQFIVSPSIFSRRLNLWEKNMH